MAQTRTSIGCRLVEHGNEVLVQKIFPNGAVHLSGKIAVGDIVIEVDGEQVFDVRQAEDLIAGQRDTLISIKIRRGGPTGGDIEAVPLMRQDGLIDDSNSEEDMIGIAAALHLIQVGVHVDQVIPGGPAWCSGVIRAGTIITAIDGVNVVGGHLHPSEITAMIRGAVGTRVNLQIAAEDEHGSARFVDLVRAWTLVPEAVRSFRQSLHLRIAPPPHPHTAGRFGHDDPPHDRPSSRLLSPLNGHSTAGAREGPGAGEGSSAELLGAGARGQFAGMMKALQALRGRMEREEAEMGERYDSLSDELAGLARTMEGLGAVVHASLAPHHSSRA